MLKYVSINSIINLFKSLIHNKIDVEIKNRVYYAHWLVILLIVCIHLKPDYPVSRSHILKHAHMHLNKPLMVGAYLYNIYYNSYLCRYIICSYKRV